MKFTTHPHKSDLLTITREELHELLAGRELSVSAMYVRMEEDRKPDQVVYPVTASYRGELGFALTVSVRDQLKLTFDSNTGKLKAAEVL